MNTSMFRLLFDKLCKLTCFCTFLVLLFTMNGFATELPEMKITYSGFMYANNWTPPMGDNTICEAPNDSFLTAFNASLLNKSDHLSGTLMYQINLSGSGWLQPVSEHFPTGSMETSMPIEAIRLELTEELALHYDIYYSVLQNGTWIDWVRNGAVAGIENSGFRIDGIRASIVKKSQPAPKMTMPRVIDPMHPMIALTFDDGPNPSTTNQVLDVLEAYDAKATFFLVGSRVPSSKDTIARMASTGQQIGNHSYDHKDLSSLSVGEIQNQIQSTSDLIYQASGIRPNLVRPPYGAYNQKVTSTMASMGVSGILWSIDTLDWSTKNVQATINTVLTQIKDGDIVLMHDIHPSTAKAAKTLIPELINRGLQLVTVEELATYRGHSLSPGGIYSRFRP